MTTHIRTTFSLLLILLLGLGAPTASAQRPVVHQWNVFETSFLAAKDYDNPFRDLEARATFTAPSGEKHTVPLV